MQKFFPNNALNTGNKLAFLSFIDISLIMMHTSVIFNPWLSCICVWCGWNFVTDKSTMNDACMYLQVFGLCIYDACIYHLWPLTLVHVCFMCICMMHAQYIYDPGPWSWCMHVGMMHVSMMRQILWRTNQRPNGQGDSRSRTVRRHAV